MSRINVKGAKDMKVYVSKLRIFQSAKTTFEYLSLSFAQAGMPVHTLTTPSLADGLTVPTVGINAFATGAPLIDKVTRQYCTYFLYFALSAQLPIAETVERLYCKRLILCLASSKILTPTPLTARRVCTH
jgi:hypothetical protein